jgi:hypothetical protein
MTFLLALLLAQAAQHPCVEDAKRLCPGVQPGQAIAACLKEHKAADVRRCKARIAEFREGAQAREADAEALPGTKPRQGAQRLPREHKDQVSPECREFFAARWTIAPRWAAMHDRQADAKKVGARGDAPARAAVVECLQHKSGAAERGAARIPGNDFPSPPKTTSKDRARAGAWQALQDWWVSVLVCVPDRCWCGCPCRWLTSTGTSTGTGTGPGHQNEDGHELESTHQAPAPPPARLCERSGLALFAEEPAPTASGPAMRRRAFPAPPTHGAGSARTGRTPSSRPAGFQERAVALPTATAAEPRAGSAPPVPADHSARRPAPPWCASVSWRERRPAGAARRRCRRT